MKCPGCGAPSRAQEGECSKCGLRLPARPEADPGPSCSILLVILAVLIVLFLAGPLRWILRWL